MEKELKKKIIGGIAIVALVAFGWNFVQTSLSNNTPAEATPTPTATSVPILDGIKKDISDLSDEINSLKGNDSLIMAKLDQLTKLLQMIEAEVAGLHK